MKKHISLILILLLLCAIQIPALAAPGSPEFENWYVLCGMSGWDFEDTTYNKTTNQLTVVSDHLEPGTKLQIHSFDTTTNKYLLVADDKNFKPKGDGYVYVTEEELKSNFIAVDQVVPAEQGQELATDVTCVITSDNGVMLRQGPAKTFPRFLVVPTNAQVVFRYTYSYGGYHWGFITYKGQDGWICTDFTRTLSGSPVPVAEPTTPQAEVSSGETETDATEVTSSEPLTPPNIDSPEVTTAPDNDTETSESPVSIPDNNQDQYFAVSTRRERTEQNNSLFSEGNYIILVCCLCAVVLALSCVVVMLIVKRKK